MSAPTPSEAVRVAVQECKRFAKAAMMGALNRPADRVSDPHDLLIQCFERIDALAALSLHVGDAGEPVAVLVNVHEGMELAPMWLQVDDSDNAYRAYPKYRVYPAVPSDVGATLSGSGSAGSAPSPSVSAADAAPIPGANVVRVGEQICHVSTCNRTYCKETQTCQDALLTPYSTLSHIRSDEELELYVQERIAATPPTLTDERIREMAYECLLDRPHHFGFFIGVRACMALLAQAIVTREGQDPQGLGGEAIERGPAGMRPEEIATTPTEGPAQTLTDEEIEELWSAWVCGPSDAISTFARAIESKVRASTLTDPEGAS